MRFITGFILIFTIYLSGNGQTRRFLNTKDSLNFKTEQQTDFTKLSAEKSIESLIFENDSIHKELDSINILIDSLKFWERKQNDSINRLIGYLDHIDIEKELDRINHLTDSIDFANDSISNLFFHLEKMRFEYWLNSHGLTGLIFRDTIIKKIPELWSYLVPQQSINDFYFKIPSFDSSYFLLTNFYPGLNPNNEYLDFQFLEAKTNRVYIGMKVLKKPYSQILDYFWYDNETIFILGRDKPDHFELVKLKMKVNQIWMYKT